MIARRRPRLHAEGRAVRVAAAQPGLDRLGSFSRRRSLSQIDSHTSAVPSGPSYTAKIPVPPSGCRRTAVGLGAAQHQPHAELAPGIGLHQPVAFGREDREGPRAEESQADPSARAPLGMQDLLGRFGGISGTRHPDRQDPPAPPRWPRPRPAQTCRGRTARPAGRRGSSPPSPERQPPPAHAHQPPPGRAGPPTGGATRTAARPAGRQHHRLALDHRLDRPQPIIVAAGGAQHLIDAEELVLEACARLSTPARCWPGLPSTMKRRRASGS